MKTTQVRAFGDPNDRPPGFPCFNCGKQVKEECAIEVLWENHGVTTMEAIHPDCKLKYTIYECAPWKRFLQEESIA